MLQISQIKKFRKLKAGTTGREREEDVEGETRESDRERKVRDRARERKREQERERERERGEKRREYLKAARSVRPSASWIAMAESLMACPDHSLLGSMVAQPTARS